MLSRLAPAKRLPQFVDQFDRDGREIVDEIERVLDLVRDAGGQLAERGELLGLDQAVLRGPQVLQRLRQFAGAGLDAFEQPHVLDRDRRLVGEGRDQLDLLVGEWPYLCARQGQNADRHALAQHRNAKDRAEVAQHLRLAQSVFRISLNVGNVNDLAVKQRSPSTCSDPSCTGCLRRIAGESPTNAVSCSTDETSVVLVG